MPSISTKTGDDGETSLRYGRRVAKTHPRVEANGTLDELGSALGLARSSTKDPIVKDQIKTIQQDLIRMAGCLAVAAEDQHRKDHRNNPLSEKDLQLIEGLIVDLESRQPPMTHFVLPGESLAGAALHLSRSVTRRAEREVLSIRESGESVDPLILAYLNRLSDLLWLLARHTDNWA